MSSGGKKKMDRVLIIQADTDTCCGPEWQKTAVVSLSVTGKWFRPALEDTLDPLDNHWPVTCGNRSFKILYNLWAADNKAIVPTKKCTNPFRRPCTRTHVWAHTVNGYQIEVKLQYLGHVLFRYSFHYYHFIIQLQFNSPTLLRNLILLHEYAQILLATNYTVSIIARAGDLYCI